MASVLLILISSTTVLSSDPVVGKVIWEGRGCDFYIIETAQFYVLVEVFSGSLNDGDKIVGELHSYNFKDLINLSRNDTKVRVWIENYWNRKETCFEWLREHDKCGYGK